MSGCPYNTGTEAKSRIDTDKLVEKLVMTHTDIVTPKMFEFNLIQRARKHKGLIMDNARDVMKNCNFFATMMIFKGHADAMVSVSIHSTAETIRPALQIIRTKPGFPLRPVCF